MPNPKPRPAHRPRELKAPVILRLWIESEAYEWLRAQPGGISATVRRAVKEKRERTENPQFMTIRMGGEEEEIVEVIRARK